MVRICDKCGKANQPTRKFCIRCGAKLIKVSAKKRRPKAATPAPQATSPAQPAVLEVPTQGEPPSPVTEDSWVKPSEIPKDRVRSTSGAGRRKTELEKAREVFEKAESVGIDEAAGSGVVESRMLRASEVKELLEGPGMIGEDIPAPQMMEGSEPLPPEAAELMTHDVPTSTQIEVQILGSKSAFVDHPPEPEPPAPQPEEAAAGIPTGFTSSKYASAESPAAPASVAEPGKPPSVAPEAESSVEEDLDLVIACPACGNVMNVDMFEYPREVYSAMGAARLKQARFFIVQGKPEDAKRVVNIAIALFTKAENEQGRKEAEKLSSSIQAKG
ncbi:MAG: hypothetical protein DRP09_04115 [Candidatus Thorarchaeota archaeon]|nr:MAG: hypothetical protein DRP09_04115 [Candidatus Thorarchaeota archaeon]